jgi:hypothetical protein
MQLAHSHWNATRPVGFGGLGQLALFEMFFVNSQLGDEGPLSFPQVLVPPDKYLSGDKYLCTSTCHPTSTCTSTCTSTSRSPAGWAPDPARARPEPKSTRAAGRWGITSTCRSPAGWAPVAAGMCARLRPSPTHAEADPNRMTLGKHKYLSNASWMGGPGRGRLS